MKTADDAGFARSQRAHRPPSIRTAFADRSESGAPDPRQTFAVSCRAVTRQPLSVRIPSINPQHSSGEARAAAPSICAASSSER